MTHEGYWTNVNTPWSLGVPLRWGRGFSQGAEVGVGRAGVGEFQHHGMDSTPELQAQTR